MKVDLDSGLIESARFVASPHFDQRANGERAEPQIDLVVIHGISLPPGEFGGPYVEQFFTHQLDPLEHPYFAEIIHLDVSSHLFIRRDGELVQFVPFQMRAWHAGKSEYCGRQRCNDFSIGIELEGVDDVPYTEAQYVKLAEVIASLRLAYPQIGEHIVGHSDIAPGRKTDPGPAFDWQYLHQLLDELS